MILNNDSEQMNLRPNGKPRKTKDERGPRKRRRKKKTNKKENENIDYSEKIDIILKNFETHYSDDDNYENEDDIDDQERARWKAWAMYACEVERKRRIKILQDISAEEERERKKRSMWAINAIEKEQQERISSQFLASLCSTQWFEGTVSLYNENYELVCPYYKLGCRISCRRLNLKNHLEQCPYAIETKDEETFDNSYEVVCPNSSLGCSYVGDRTDLQQHFTTCPFKGLSREEEEEERMILRERVILLQEEERRRRVVEDNIGSSANKTVLLHNLLHTQLQNVVSRLHDEVENYHKNIQKIQNDTKERYECIISKVSSSVKSLWPFASIEVFGSYATNLHTSNSDLDLVVCFSDGFQDLINSIGSIPFIKVLANHLERSATDLRINAVHLYAQVPVIKLSYLNDNIPIDISINGHHHSGLASTELTIFLMKYLKPLPPLLILFKEYLRSKDLNDAYRGGLSSYGVFLLVILPMIKKVTANKVSKEISSPINIAKQVKKVTSFNSPISRYNNKIIAHITSYNHLDNFSLGQSIVPDNNLTILFPRLNLDSDHIKYDFIDKQRQRGKKTALALLGLDDDNFKSSSGKVSELLTAENSIYGIILNEILIVFGEQFQCGRHGFSLRNAGFRFDINAGAGHPIEHPWSDDPLLIEDPLNYLNNVGRNCYKAQQFQRVMADAHEILKNITVRHDPTHINEMKKTDFLLSEIFGTFD